MAFGGRLGFFLVWVGGGVCVCVCEGVDGDELMVEVTFVAYQSTLQTEQLLVVGSWVCLGEWQPARALSLVKGADGVTHKVRIRCYVFLVLVVVSSCWRRKKKGKGGF